MQTKLSRRILSKAKRDMYLHGTSSYFLRSILKHGLVPKPQKRVWDSDGDLSLKSFDGVYLTKSFQYALAAATDAYEKFGGNPMIVVVQITVNQPTIRLDEDLLGLQGLFEPVDMYEVILFIKTFNKIVEDGIESLVYSLKEFFNIPQDKIRRMLSSEILETLRTAYKYGFLMLLGGMKFDKDDTRLFKSQLNLIIDVPKDLQDEIQIDAEKGFTLKHSVAYYWKKYAEAVEKVLKDLRSVPGYGSSYERSAPHPVNNVRLTQPVKFSGANKILGIYVLSKNDELYKVVYEKSSVGRSMLKGYKKVDTLPDEE